MINKTKIQRNGSQRVNTNGSQKSLTKTVNQILDSKLEQKWIPFDVSTTVSNTGSLDDLTSLSQGTNAVTRVGSSITVKSLEMDMVCTIADTTNLVRLRIFEWIPSDTSDVPSLSELQYYSSSVISPLLPYKPSRFRLLHDHMFILDTYHPYQRHKFKLKLNHTVQYDLSVDTGSRHIYMALQSDSGAASHPAVAYNALLKFVDV